MNPSEERWKYRHGLLLPKEYVEEVDDRLEEIILRLPCYEPTGLEIEFKVRDLLRHLLVLGSTGAGKTTLLNQVWRELISYRSPKTGQPCGLLILDCQGGHAVDHIRQLAAEAGRASDVLVLSREENHFNPFGDLTSFAAIEQAASKIISATRFSGDSASENDSYWTENTRNLIVTGLLLPLVTNQDATLTGVLRSISSFFLAPEWTPESKDLIKRFEEIVGLANPQLSSGIRTMLEMARMTLKGWEKFDSRTKSILRSCVAITISPFLATSALAYWDSTKGSPINPADGTFPPFQESVVLVPVVRLPGDTTDEALISFLEESLEKVWVDQQSQSPRPYSTDEQRLVLMDDGYRNYAQDEKLGTELPQDLEKEKELFIGQVYCARRNHQAAQGYLRQLLKTDRGLRVESAYRIVHASYKIYWLREHSMRWTSVLAHYIEGVQTEYLPSATSPSSQVDFLHYEAPPESLYVAAALVGHGFSSSLVPGFCSILTKKYTGISTEELQGEAIYLAGWCAFLREVAIAQVQLMNQILDLDSPWHSCEQPKRGIHRAEGIYGDFWQLPSLRQNPSKMRDLAYLCVLEWLSPASAASAVAPYRAFLEAHRASVSEAGGSQEDV